MLVAGLSPAWQRILVFERLAAGEVNRTVETLECASGKVLNVARAAACFPGQVRAVCPLGGTTGQAIAAEWQAAGLAAQWVNTAAATRVCTTLVDRQSRQVTELVEATGPMTPAELEATSAAVQAAAAGHPALVISGSLAPGVSAGWPAQMLHTTSSAGVLDVRGAELMAALAQQPLLIKPNRAELEQTLGRTLNSVAELLAAMRELVAGGARWTLVTQGAREAWLVGHDKVWRFEPPMVEVLNPIGCGDCLTAALAWAWEQGNAMPDCVRWGLAAAAENAQTLLPARLAFEAVAARAEQIAAIRAEV